MNVSNPVNTTCQCQNYSATATKESTISQNRSFADLLALYSLQQATGDSLNAGLSASAPGSYLYSPSSLSYGLPSADLLSSLLLYSAFSGRSFAGTPMLSGTSLLSGTSMLSGLLRNPILSQYTSQSLGSANRLQALPGQYRYY